MRQQPCAAVARIGSDRRLAEGYIANGKIKTPIRETCRLKALCCDTYIRMRSGGDARRECILLHAANVALSSHLLRHRGEEPPCPAGRFEDIPLGKAEVLQALIDCLGDIGRRIVGIQNTAARCAVFLVRQMRLKCIVLCRPRLIGRVERLGEPAESAVGCEEALLL